MTVAELIKRLKEYPENATVIMCMDWTADPEKDEALGQWEDKLGEVAAEEADRVYLLNENFK